MNSTSGLRLDMHVDETDSKDHSTWLQEDEEQIGSYIRAHRK